MIEYDKETEYVNLFSEVTHIKAKNIKFGEGGLVMSKKINEDKTTSIFFVIKLSAKMLKQKTESACMSVISELVSMHKNRIIEINYDKNITKANLYTVEVKIKNVQYIEDIQLYMRVFLNEKKIIDKLFDFQIRDVSFNEKEKISEIDDRVVSKLTEIIEDLKLKTE